jgi:bis(5'-nucleosyl)-tetraphosphatase (symmetrical)
MSGATPDDRVRIFIGDVHGCATELENLLEDLDYDPARHALYYCGDIVNRGPRSLDALRLARQTAAGAVIGNHDLHLVARAAGGRDAKPMDTLEEVLSATDSAELIAWLRNRPVVIEWADIVLVHAGLHPGWTNLAALNRQIALHLDAADPLRDADLRFATTVRYCDPAGEVPSRAESAALLSEGTETDATVAAPFAPWHTYWRGPRKVVFGHWAQRGLVRTDFARGLDTGCVWGGSLTAWIAEEERLVSVPARARYQQI